MMQLLNVFLAVTKLKLLPFVLTTLVGEIPVAFIGCFVGQSLGMCSPNSSDEWSSSCCTFVEQSLGTYEWSSCLWRDVLFCGAEFGDVLVNF
jgi:hypothetical protein